jgi:hypothetical protein
MSAEGRLAKARRLGKRIEAEIARAIALHGILACLEEDPDLLGRVRGEAWLPLIREAMQTDLLMTLCRLHEHGREENATIPVVVSFLGDPRLRKLLADERAGEEARTLHAGLQRTGAMKRLRAIRDRVIAHNDTRGIERLAAFGDHAMLLEETARIADRIHRAVGAAGRAPFDLDQEAWKTAARDFWLRLAGPAK